MLRVSGFVIAETAHHFSHDRTLATGEWVQFGHGSPIVPETLDQPAFVEALHDVLVHLHDQTVLQSHPFATIAVDARDRRNRRKGRGNLSDRMSPEIPGAVLAQDIYDALISLQPR
ncbi:MAG: hypothetical protein EBY11_11140, partial [Proteobacteria bacterium]|nr:hypothetical protein [Pseudomonadota bacterium]